MEEALDLSFDRLLMMMNKHSGAPNYEEVLQNKRFRYHLKMVSAQMSYSDILFII